MLLKMGSRGDDVKTVQSVLGITADGIFGSTTEALVKKWQAANGLVVDGMVGASTWSKMVDEKPEVRSTYNTDTASLDFDLSKLESRIPATVIDQIADATAKFNITNVLRLAHFLAQCHHESGGFKLTTENLNYSARGLLATFPKYFDETTAAQCERQPELIASKVYANRMGNGAEESKEGYIYRGRGYIQLTGKSNYIAFADFIGQDCVAQPDLVATQYPLASAAFFFHKNDVWSVCERGVSDAATTAVTKKINGGTIGLEERIKLLKDYHGYLTA